MLNILYIAYIYGGENGNKDNIGKPKSRQYGTVDMDKEIVGEGVD